jgi:quercetin dioxygenase-like cupin family protein
MELFTLAFGPVEEFGSTGVRMARAALAADPSQFAVNVAHVEAGGTIGPHPTRLWQLFAVVHGSGWVSGQDGRRVPLRAGEAALWEPGEEHASGADEPMTAVVVQSHVRPAPG